MSFGDQTLTFVALTQGGAPGWGGLRQSTEAPGGDVEGCQFSSTSGSESDQSTDVSSEVWTAICPPNPAALAAKPNGVIRYEGSTFQIDGPVRPRYDGAGRVHHVTILCKRQSG